ncbi:hypothetical protein [Human adenovirus 14]|uniref:Uncharacterized protein n=1 Tax=Human adenovirus 14 TaxID=10521 RepID=I3PVC4_9ADEN|nr:hypothetical protein [Human adenovirus 14]
MLDVRAGEGALPDATELPLPCEPQELYYEELDAWDEEPCLGRPDVQLRAPAPAGPAGKQPLSQRRLLPTWPKREEAMYTGCVTLPPVNVYPCAPVPLALRRY